ncbi:MAG: hypothetical protein ACLTSL_00105 [Odoribacter splanchnicus]
MKAVLFRRQKSGLWEVRGTVGMESEMCHWLVERWVRSGRRNEKSGIAAGKPEGLIRLFGRIPDLEK